MCVSSLGALQGRQAEQGGVKEMRRRKYGICGESFSRFHFLEIMCGQSNATTSSALLLRPSFSLSPPLHLRKRTVYSSSIENFGTWLISTLIALLALATIGSSIA